MALFGTEWRYLGAKWNYVGASWRYLGAKWHCPRHWTLSSPGGDSCTPAGLSTPLPTAC